MGDAIRTTEKLVARGDIRPSQRLPQLWRLRLAEARRSEEAKGNLRRQLTSLENGARDVEVLLAVRAAYRYCKALLLFDPRDSALLSRTAILLADKNLHLAEALRLARAASALGAFLRNARRVRPVRHGPARTQQRARS